MGDRIVPWLAIPVLAAVVAAGSCSQSDRRARAERTEEDVRLVVVPVVDGAEATSDWEEVAHLTVDAVARWYGNYRVALGEEVQSVRQSPAGEMLFNAEEAVNPCTDRTWERVLPLVQQLKTQPHASTTVVVVVFGGVIRTANSTVPTHYGLTCRLGTDECGEAVEVTVPGPEGRVEVDALIAIDWRSEQITPLGPVLAHEVGHSLGLAHHGDPPLPCQVPADTTAANNLMVSASNIGAESRLAEFILTPEQERWLANEIGPPRGEQN
jgi:hypothetical protein